MWQQEAIVFVVLFLRFGALLTAHFARFRVASNSISLFGPKAISAFSYTNRTNAIQCNGKCAHNNKSFDLSDLHCAKRANCCHCYCRRRRATKRVLSISLSLSFYLFIEKGISTLLATIEKPAD